MHCSTLTWIALGTNLFVSAALSETPRDATPPPNNVLRYDGKLYEFYSVKSISPAGALINHSKGTLVIPLEKLPPTITTPYK